MNFSLPCSETEPATCCLNNEKGEGFYHRMIIQLLRDIPAAQFELFDDIADLLKSVNVSVLPPNRVGNDKEGCSLKK